MWLTSNCVATRYNTAQSKLCNAGIENAHTKFLGQKPIDTQDVYRKMYSEIWKLREGYEPSILLLEDEAELAASLKEFLELYSCKVTVVRNGIQKLRKIITKNYELVLCDLLMPTLAGDRFYNAVERIKPALCRRFIFMTLQAAEPRYDNFLRKSGCFILSKPFEMYQLLTAVRMVLIRARRLDAAERQALSGQSTDQSQASGYFRSTSQARG